MVDEEALAAFDKSADACCYSVDSGSIISSTALAVALTDPLDSTGAAASISPRAGQEKSG